ncbi:MAG TPA: ABC transporter ATP-binding protein [Rhabdaerophilum sp.]|nr:ABC transporter ATP-binding protein [Rhabdaerophilum sp.]
MLEIDKLTVAFRDLTILRGLSFALERGETLGIVGESGSGKTVTALSIMGLLPRWLQMEGAIRLAGRNIAGLSETNLCALRGRRIGMVFQEPMTALNPVQRVGEQIAEALVLHGVMDREAARIEAIRLIGRVGLDRPEQRARSFPHELSGGQRQRVMIAMAISCRPDVLIADEPTSALDVTVQAEILVLLREIRDETGMAMLIISHDLAVISRIADRVLVLYGGAPMETGATHTLLGAPRQPYTRGLLAAIPRGMARTTRLSPIPGQVPDLRHLPRGCPFSTRCPKADALCAEQMPPPDQASTRAWCHHLERGGAP